MNCSDVRSCIHQIPMLSGTSLLVMLEIVIPSFLDRTTTVSWVHYKRSCMRTLPTHRPARASVTHYTATATVAAVAAKRTPPAQHQGLTTHISSRCDPQTQCQWPCVRMLWSYVLCHYLHKAHKKFYIAGLGDKLLNTASWWYYTDVVGMWAQEV